MHDAHQQLHPVQEAMTYGSYWVCFGNLDQGYVQWGYVHTLDELSVIGDDLVEAADEALRVDGLLSGTVYSTISPDGVPESTHKAHVWPIEVRLFDMAREAGWDYSRLDDAGRLLLNLAFAEQRVHLLPKWSE